MNNIKIGVVVVALAAAGIIFWITSTGDATPPAGVDTSTDWKCLACRHEFSLTSVECREAEVRAGDTAPIHCNGCAEKQAYRAATCTVCGTKYFGPEAPGQSGACPKCHPNEPIWNLPPESTPRAGGAKSAEEGAPRPPVPVRKQPPIE